VVAAVEGARSLPPRACIVTFDDGLRCHLELALPTLDSIGVPAVFFVPGMQLAENRALTVHKLHHLRERLADDELERELAAAGVTVDSVDDATARAHYRYDEPSAARIKYVLNVALPPDRAASVVDAIFARIEDDERAFCSRLYVSQEDLGRLAQAPHGVGAHSYAHRPLARLDPAERRRDVELSASVLESILGRRPLAFSYPHGTPSTVDRETARDVAAAGFRVAFTMERALNATLDEPCLLARLDANDAPGGSRPLLDLDGGTPTVRAGATAARLRYFDETAAGA
jgi:peptidoglycan/xylan/chitin deacetylase (PgdA/CDA1 family)